MPGAHGAVLRHHLSVPCGRDAPGTQRGQPAGTGGRGGSRGSARSPLPVPRSRFPSALLQSRRSSRLPTPPRCPRGSPLAPLCSRCGAAVPTAPAKRVRLSARGGRTGTSPAHRSSPRSADGRTRRCSDPPPPVGAPAAPIRPAAPQSVPALRCTVFPSFTEQGSNCRADGSPERRIRSLNSPSRGAGTPSGPAHGDVPSPLLSGPHMPLFYISFPPPALIPAFLSPLSLLQALISKNLPPSPRCVCPHTALLRLLPGRPSRSAPHIAAGGRCPVPLPSLPCRSRSPRSQPSLCHHLPYGAAYREDLTLPARLGPSEPLRAPFQRHKAEGRRWE